MSSTASPSVAPERKALTRRQSIGLVFICTLLGAAGQIFIKTGAKTSATAAPWTTLAGIWANLYAMAINPNLIGGYALYALMTVVFIFALRDEELSVVYPVISLTYVWVAGLSIWLFGESVNLPKILGILVIVAGVGVLGMDGRK
ncbi:MAG: 4-amino-4-deoxy-L-arabinose transferase [Bryobacteraceae bacterium]